MTSVKSQQSNVTPPPPPSKENTPRLNWYTGANMTDRSNFPLSNLLVWLLFPSQKYIFLLVQHLERRKKIPFSWMWIVTNSLAPWNPVVPNTCFRPPPKTQPSSRDKRCQRKIYVNAGFSSTRFKVALTTPSTSLFKSQSRMTISLNSHFVPVSCLPLDEHAPPPPSFPKSSLVKKKKSP